MNKLMRIFAWCLLFLVFVASIVFSYANPEPVSLSFGFTTLSPQPLAVWVIAAFVMGGILGVLLGIGLVRNLRLRLELRRLRSQLLKTEQELTACKTSQQNAVAANVSSRLRESI